jgi:hypothetical protein
MGLLLALALVTSAGVVAREGLRPRAWSVATAWSWTAGGEIKRLAAGRRGRGGAFVVVLAGTGLHVLDGAGRELRSGSTSPAVRLEVADVDGDGDDEIAAADWTERPAVQLYDELLQPLGPAVRLLEMGLPAALRAFDLDGDGRRELIVADFRGCLTALDYPTFRWDHCFTPGGGPSGDPFAVRDLALARAGGGERLLVGARDAGETQALDARGAPRWRFDAGLQNLLELLALDLDGDGRDEVALLSRAHGALVLDAAGARVTREPRDDYVAAATPLRWGGAGAQIALAHGDGRLTVLRAAGAPSAALDGARVAPAQILHLAAADADGDGRDELLAGLVTRRLMLLASGGARVRAVWEADVLAEITRLLALRAEGSRTAFLVASGATLTALDVRARPAALWRAVPVATAATLGLLLLAGAALLSLRPPGPREVTT